MKSLAFLLVASLIFLFVGLALTEGQTPPPAAAEPIARPPATPERPLNGSANVKPKPTSPALIPPIKSDLAEALRADDLCQAAYVAGKISPQNLQPEISGVLAALGAPSALQEMYSAGGPVFGPIEAKKRFPSPFLNLMYALRLADILPNNGASHLSAHGATALTILRELEAANPGNGVYPYFQLGILRAQEAKSEEILETAERVARASFFDAGLSAQLAELEGSRWQSATNFYVLDWISNQVHSISYYSSLDAINSITSNPGGEEVKDRIGRLMMQEGERASRRAQYHGFDGGAYSYGTVYTSAENDLYLANLSDQIAGYEWKYQPYISRQKNDCKREEYDAYYEEMRGHP